MDMKGLFVRKILKWPPIRHHLVWAGATWLASIQKNMATVMGQFTILGVFQCSDIGRDSHVANRENKTSCHEGATWQGPVGSSNGWVTRPGWKPARMGVSSSIVAGIKFCQPSCELEKNSELQKNTAVNTYFLKMKRWRYLSPTFQDPEQRTPPQLLKASRYTDWYLGIL